jgi:hypothetical protein
MALFVLHTVTALFFAIVTLGAYVLEIRPSGWTGPRAARFLFCLAFFVAQSIATVMYWLPKE